jgi:predicted alpha/beta-hydrolase family hydrolase
VSDRAVLLAHGAGSDRNAAALVAVDGRLAAAGIPSLRFDYPYRQAGRKAPDRPPVLEQATREAAAQLAKDSGLPPERLALGGRSMGGRYCSMVAAHDTDPVPVLGLVLLGYPLHPAGKPEQLRTEHFPRLTMPVLFVSGDRDALAPRPSLEKAIEAIPGEVTLHWLPGADHGYRVPRSSGRSPAGILEEVAEVAAAWVAAL